MYLSFLVFYLRVIFLLWKCLHASFQGRKARLKVTRSSTATQNRYSRGGPSPGSTHSPYSNYSTNSMNRLAYGTSTFAGEEHSNGTLESWTSSCVMAGIQDLCHTLNLFLRREMWLNLIVFENNISNILDLNITTIVAYILELLSTLKKKNFAFYSEFHCNFIMFYS